MVVTNSKKIIRVLILSICILLCTNNNISLALEVNPNQRYENSIYILQLEERANLLRKALDEFEATSKEQVMNLYAEGVKSRSGPLQYSVMCKTLKDKFAKKMEEDKNYAWVTGVSSPWITEYKIMKMQKEKNNEYKATIVFLLETSSGPFATSKTIITIRNKNNSWCIIDIKEE